MGYLLQLAIIAPAAIVFAAGIRWGRLTSGIALILCLFGIFVIRQLAITDSIPHVVRGVAGFGTAFGALTSIGPIVSKRWVVALVVSGAAIATFIFSGFPLIFACGIIGACTSYP